MLVDLQIHSTYSDGYLTPTEVAEFLYKQGVRVAALTDHNTVGGVYEFKKACQQYKIKPIVGIELYTRFGNHTFNTLWYNFEPDSPDLHNILRESQRRRRNNMRRTLKKLTASGFKLDINKILDKYNHYIPLNHIADDIVSIQANLKKIKKELNLKEPREEDIIRGYLRNEKYGKLKNSFISIERIVALRKKIGGQLVLCHPAKHSYIRRPFLEKIKKIGFNGIEMLSPHHSYGAIMYIQQLVREYSFIATGGSDFHRREGGNYAIQNSWQYFTIDSKLLSGIKKIIG